MPTLTEVQLRTLTSAIDRMVPADNFPSASQAGCIDFLLHLIELEHLEETYRAGLDGLEIEAQKHGTAFADLDSVRQDEILKESEVVEQSPDWAISPSQFIGLLARQTIEGYYSDPGNRGNRDCIAWKMIGFEVRG